MKRNLLSAVTAAMAISAVAAPRLHWINPVYNFGAFHEEMGKVSCTFKAVNTGDEAVTVISATANCGCARPAYTKDPVAPGDTLSVTVTYDPSGRPGRFTKNIKVVTNAPGNAANLKIRGTVIASSGTLASRYPVEAGRARLSNDVSPFGTGRKGRVLAAAINIYNPTPDTIRPQVSGLPPYLNALFRPTSIPPGEQGILSLTAYTDRTPEWGTVTGSFRLIPDSAYPELGTDISTVMILNEDFSKLTPGQREKAPVAKLSAQNLDFGEITQSKMTRTFTITNTGQTPLIVRRIDTPDKALTVKISRMKIKPSASATVTVTADKTAIGSDGILDGRITLITNTPDEPTRIIRAVGTVAR